MSTSELRRGPGWWMDLDGQWNPPEEWPESSPPLPGWIRGADGQWSAPSRRSTDEPSPNSLTINMPQNAEPIDDTPVAGASIRRPIPEVALSIVPPLESIGDPEAATPKHQPAASSPGTTSLSFSQATANVQVSEYDRSLRHARYAAVLAAVTASMLAAGLVLLLLLL